MSLDYVALILLDRRGIGAAASRMEDEATVQATLLTRDTQGLAAFSEGTARPRRGEEA
jgi:hypothetical protein